MIQCVNISRYSLKSLNQDAKDGDTNYTTGILNTSIMNMVSRIYAKEIITKKYRAHLTKIVKKEEMIFMG